MLFSGYTSIHQDAFSTIIIMLKMKDLSYQISDTRFNHSNYTTNKSIKLHCQQLLSPCNVSNYLSFKTTVSGQIQDFCSQKTYSATREKKKLEKFKTH